MTDHPKLRIVPVTFADATSFCSAHHRHHRPPVGHKASIAVAHGALIVGVAILGRPVARHLDDGHTLEVLRVATDGTRNACSKLYGASWRLAQALGYTKLVTYTLATEPGSSLRAVGWTPTDVARSSYSWSTPSRPRADKAPLQAKIRWEIALTPAHSTP